MKKLDLTLVAPDAPLVIRKAAVFAVRHHVGAVYGGERWGSEPEPFVHHPARVARRLTRAWAPSAAIVAGWLHDVVEDTEVTLDVIEFEFGAQVAGIVDRVTKIDGESYDDRIRRAAAEPNSALVKLHDILENRSKLPPGHSMAKRYARGLEILGYKGK